MNAPFALLRDTVSLVDLRQPDEAARIEGFVAEHGGSVFHRPAWLLAIEAGTGQRARGLLAEKAGQITGWLPLNEIHSPLFGRMLASSGFAVEGGVLANSQATALILLAAACELAQRLSCPTIELRGGPAGEGWQVRTDSHCGFIEALAADDDAQLKAIPRKQRAEVRKGLKSDLTIHVGTAPRDRHEHYAVYAESVRNLGTPVFPRSLFDAVLDSLDADILTIRHQHKPVASVLSLYHGGAVMPYWGGGTWEARALRANDRMYYELMMHARQRGCTRFDFGRSKTGSGAWYFKKNWGFAPQPLSYASWTAPGHEARDADPTSAKHQSQIALWKRLPLLVTNRIGPMVARGLG
ncbi:FemAB family XrtA/PEP-CTERM system-associated protein [Aurantiacibacter poecillastricola]|uniref:FemAB family XrtA/PEP-CTERM system-associated protein n=1 Tax=Aurantiacibacter poecillastricola TaxID=3064385 RepID=UPI00273DB6C8|nr:FemAB family XrtA/PEP-CTERM system-associated protein [Aurantiacibacter sp. 219JJ12-13]MDP5262159.1 FemAB family PEP-CTERM system-associated protein [Aurantiacibacter sp. 219JJ12-13]